MGEIEIVTSCFDCSTDFDDDEDTRKCYYCQKDFCEDCRTSHADDIVFNEENLEWKKWYQTNKDHIIAIERQRVKGLKKK